MINKVKDFKENDRRAMEDRRAENAAITFPIRLACGTIVKSDRRFMPERRLRRISVDELQIKNSEFDELFDKFS